MRDPLVNLWFLLRYSVKKSNRHHDQPLNLELKRQNQVQVNIFCANIAIIQVSLDVKIFAELRSALVQLRYMQLGNCSAPSPNQLSWQCHSNDQKVVANPTTTFRHRTSSIVATVAVAAQRSVVWPRLQSRSARCKINLLLCKLTAAASMQIRNQNSDHVRHFRRIPQFFVQVKND